MGLRGPPPKPSVLKAAAGNPGKRRLNENEPIPPSGEIKPPRTLTKLGLEIWNEVAPVCIAMRTLTTADRMTFARYCDLYARFLELRQLVWANGALGSTYHVKDEKGQLRYIAEIPQAAEIRQVGRMLVQLEDRFGLSAAARARLQVQPASPAAVIASASSTQSPVDADARAFFAAGGRSKQPPLVG